MNECDSYYHEKRTIAGLLCNVHAHWILHYENLCLQENKANFSEIVSYVSFVITCMGNIRLKEQSYILDCFVRLSVNLRSLCLLINGKKCGQWEISDNFINVACSFSMKRLFNPWQVSDLEMSYYTHIPYTFSQR